VDVVDGYGEDEVGEEGHVAVLDEGGESHGVVCCVV
jgi:hypothetical protein